MKARLAIALGMIGLFLSCTLLTAHAVEYRKDKTEIVNLCKIDLESDFEVNFVKVHSYDVANLHLSNRAEIQLPISFTHLKDEDKPDNRCIKGILNERRISKPRE